MGKEVSLSLVFLYISQYLLNVLLLFSTWFGILVNICVWKMQNELKPVSDALNVLINESNFT